MSVHHVTKDDEFAAALRALGHEVVVDKPPLMDLGVLTDEVIKQSKAKHALDAAGHAAAAWGSHHLASPWGPGHSTKLTLPEKLVKALFDDPESQPKTISGQAWQAIGAPSFDKSDGGTVTVTVGAYTISYTYHAQSDRLVPFDWHVTPAAGNFQVGEATYLASSMVYSALGNCVKEIEIDGHTVTLEDLQSVIAYSWKWVKFMCNGLTPQSEGSPLMHAVFLFAQAELFKKFMHGHPGAQMYVEMRMDEVEKIISHAKHSEYVKVTPFGKGGPVMKTGYTLGDLGEELLDPPETIVIGYDAATGKTGTFGTVEAAFPDGKILVNLSGYDAKFHEQIAELQKMATEIEAKKAADEMVEKTADGLVAFIQSNISGGGGGALTEEMFYEAMGFPYPKAGTPEPAKFDMAKLETIWEPEKEFAPSPKLWEPESPLVAKPGELMAEVSKAAKKAQVSTEKLTEALKQVGKTAKAAAAHEKGEVAKAAGLVVAYTTPSSLDKEFDLDAGTVDFKVRHDFGIMQPSANVIFKGTVS